MVSQGCSTLDCTEWYSGNKHCDADGSFMEKADKVINQAFQFESIPYNNKIKYTLLDGSTPYGERRINYHLGYYFRFQDGQVLMFANMCGGSREDYNAYNCTYGNYDGVLRCNHIVIDLNGTKPPNIYGRDVFDFYVMNDGTLRPHPQETYNYAKKIMENSWQMDY